MSVNIATARYALIAEARGSWTRDQQREAALTGKTAQPVPSDSELITDEPPLAQEIEQLDSQQDQASSSTQNDDSNKVAGSNESDTDSAVSDTSQDANALTLYSDSISSGNGDSKNMVNLLV